MSQSRWPQQKVLKFMALGGAGLLLARASIRHRRKISLRDKVVLITGGSRGLGLALAREFSRHGARIAICARDRQELSRAAQDVRQREGQIHTFTCDLLQSDQIEGLIRQVEAEMGRIDVVVNNAGTIVVGPAQSMSLDDVREVMSLNFWAAVELSMAIIPKMKAQGFGRIINVASVGAKIPVPHLAAYCASKFALAGFSSAMRSEYARDGILVTTVNPGLMRTGSPRNAHFKGDHESEYAWFSISDALPGISISARSAARRIVDATIHGDAEVTLGLPAKVAAKFYGLFPNLHTELAALINRVFPTNEDSTRKFGRESESPITRSFVRHLGHRAERELNQMQAEGAVSDQEIPK
jgi:short-subunit dehydrogenase